ncbi:MAG: alpha/beta hydrolase [Saprospiraceae bacterium]
MKITFSFVLAMQCLFVFAQSNLPKNIEVIEQFKSDYVSSRTVYVRLPLDYDSTKRYSVLYMHDGQMLFKDLPTWNGQAWAVDSTINDLVAKDKIEDLILVGVSSISDIRHSNYFPEKPFLNIPNPLRDSIASTKRGERPLFGKQVNSDYYLKFLVYELKPFIDETYATQKEAEHTLIAGSSMGGLISMYAFFEYPEVFGAAACLSTHWPGVMEQNEEVPRAFYNYLAARKSLLKGRKLYFDYGTKTLDALYEIHQERVDELFEASDFGGVYMSRQFEGAAHWEIAWRERFGGVLELLFSK